MGPTVKSCTSMSHLWTKPVQKLLTLSAVRPRMALKQTTLLMCTHRPPILFLSSSPTPLIASSDWLTTPKVLATSKMLVTSHGLLVLPELALLPQLAALPATPPTPATSTRSSPRSAVTPTTSIKISRSTSVLDSMLPHQQRPSPLFLRPSLPSDSPLLPATMWHQQEPSACFTALPWPPLWLSS